MSDTSKQLSNPYSTGGGGTHFENRVQSSFVVLMLTGGYSPCLPAWPITEIKLQGKYQNFDTDDLIVYVNQPGTNKKAKLLGQVKHFIKINKVDKVFGEVIQAAWNDYNNKSIFNKKTDIIALITGPLSATDTVNVRGLLNQAHNSKDADDFMERISKGKFTSDAQRKKLEVFQAHLKIANKNIDLSKEELWGFLKTFHLLIYDLDIKGVILALLQTLIGQYSQQRAEEMLALIEKDVTYKSEHAGTITIETIPENILSYFREPIKRTIPNDLIKIPMESIEIDWNNQEEASNLVVANLLGEWNENLKSDTEIIESLVGEDYSTWISNIREVLQHPESPLMQKNGIWKVINREKLWSTLGPRIFDNILDVFKHSAITVLSEKNPMFSLPSDKRIAASLYGKELRYSESLRKGIAESLVLLGKNNHKLINCSLNKPKSIAYEVVEKVFDNANWELWGSLNYLLPLLAEAAPNRFLQEVEKNLQKSPSPFDELFKQEGSGIGGSNYLTGLLWALETLAWDKNYLVPVTVFLGELASRDPGGNWDNRPANSLSTIFLPWFPQTMATIEKRKVAVHTLLREFPSVGWNLLISLLPNQIQTSSGTHKPKWSQEIINENENKIINNEYWEQVGNYTNLAVDIAENDIKKLSELIEHLDHLPTQSFEKVLNLLSSDDILNRQENERIILWTELVKFTSKHRRFSDAKWALDSEIVSKIEDVANKLAPSNSLNLHRILFNDRDSDLYFENDKWQEQSQRLELLRQEAIKEIITYSGLNGIIQFLKTIESPYLVGQSLGVISDSEIDLALLPELLDTKEKSLSQFMSSYVRACQHAKGWEWVDSIDKSNWDTTQVIKFLTWLPFVNETWERVELLLDSKEKEYWEQVSVNPYQPDKKLEKAIDKLIQYGRPNAAIDCLFKLSYHDKQLDIKRTVNALLLAVKTNEPSHSINTYHYVELIKALQRNTRTDPEDLNHIEWAYLPILDRFNGGSPEFLENKLATDPEFFSQVIRIIYRSDKEDKTENKLSEEQQAFALNAYRLLEDWKIPPGIKKDGSFSVGDFEYWLENVKELCEKSGHLGVALSHIGRVLFHSPPDPSGLWINHTFASAINARDAEKMRSGFKLNLFNSRGAHFVDPTGKPERELAIKYRNMANDIENAGYHRFASTLREIAESYDYEAEVIIKEHEVENQ